MTVKNACLSLDNKRYSNLWVSWMVSQPTSNVNFVLGWWVLILDFIIQPILTALKVVTVTKWDVAVFVFMTQFVLS